MGVGTSKVMSWFCFFFNSISLTLISLFHFFLFIFCYILEKICTILSCYVVMRDFEEVYKQKDLEKFQSLAKNYGFLKCSFYKN